MCRATVIGFLLSSVCLHLSPATLLAQLSRDTPMTSRPAFDSNSADSANRSRTSNSTRRANREPRLLLPEQESTRQSKNKGQRTSTKNSLWSTVISLVLVIFLILVIARLWKKNGPGIGMTIPAEAVEVLGKRRIDQRQSIYLVRLGSRILVLGSSLNGLQSLAEITDPVEADLIAGLCRQTSNDNGVVETFRSLFQKVATPQTDAPQKQQGSDSPSIDSRYSEQLRQESTEPLERVHG